MDTGLSPQLEAILTAHPGVSIGMNPETAEWEAVRHPTPTCVVIDHAPTLAELAIKLGAEGTAS